MKGIAIICMLLGHAPYFDGTVIQRCIYSFHMPLFFILAGYFTNKPEQGLEVSLKRSAKRLLLPYCLTFFLLFLWGCLQCIFKREFVWAIRPVLSFFYGSCNVIESSYGAIGVGAFWFVLGLFWSKSLFAFVLSRTNNRWLILLISFCVSICAIILYNTTKCGWWSLLPGLSSMFFIAIGWWYKNYEVPKFIKGISIAIWIVCMFWSRIDMSVCMYEHFPFDIVGACGGTLVVYYISKVFEKSNVLRYCLSWFGKNSLNILCFHTFEILSAIAWSVAIHISIDVYAYMTLFRYSLTIILVIIVTHFPFLNKVYK